jgi:hypothetical protein
VTIGEKKPSWVSHFTGSRIFNKGGNYLEGAITGQHLGETFNKFWWL